MHGKFVVKSNKKITILDNKEWCEEVRHSSSDEPVSLDMESSVFVELDNDPTLLTITS